MAIIKSTDLDFDAIKANLKTYFQQQSEFTDYDFEASGLSNILDVLAYNTHTNGLIANVAINESFLTSAQLRGSVVSHAETIGYYPHSDTAASATITYTVATSDTATNSATLPAYTQFSGTKDDVSYTFQTLEEATATNDGSGNFSFKTSAGSTSLSIKEGTIKTKTFIVGDTSDDQVYVIPDSALDKTTLKVEVFDTTTGSSFTTYKSIEDVVRIDTTSTIFIIRETPNGSYELIFGEGNVLGKSPVSGNKIVVTYLATNHSAANGISTFTANSNITINSVSYAPTIATVTNSGGGDIKETITSIKANAPLVFASQQRLVTAEDYKAVIQQRYNNLVNDVIAWGGNDNVPPEYGKVYIALDFYDTIPAATQTVTKNSIKNQLAENLSVMSIDTEFVDPLDAFVELKVAFDYDPELTGNTAETLQTNVKNLLSTYFTTNLGSFNKVFRQSAISADIDELSTAILNSSMTVKVQRRFTPTINTVADYTVIYPMVIASPGAAGDTIKSSVITFNGQNAFIQNAADSTTLQIVNATTGTVLRDNVGAYVASTGTVNITGFNPSAFVGTEMKLSVTPANQQTIRPLRNFILKLDSDLTVAAATPDFQNTQVSLTT